MPRRPSRRSTLLALLTLLSLLCSPQLSAMPTLAAPAPGSVAGAQAPWSAPLQQTTQQLSLAIASEAQGSGRVTSSPADVDCSASCSAGFEQGSVVTLTATADTGSTFDGWTGACSGYVDCVVTLSATQAVTATFQGRQLGFGSEQGCLLQADASAACWGGNSYGQAPASVAGPFAQLASGYHHNCGLKANDDAQCWGAGATNTGIEPHYGQAPANVAGPFVQLDAGIFHTCGLKPSGDAQCWGAGATNTGTNYNYGQAPASVAGPFVQLSAGAFHTCGLTSNGDAQCWGTGATSTGTNYSYGQAPASVTGPFTRLVSGYYHTCGLKTNSDMQCWGAGLTNTGVWPTYGQAPASAAGPFAQLAAHAYVTCGLKTSGDASCWGNIASSHIPASGSGPFAQLAIAANAICVVQPDTRLRCTGTTSTQAPQPSISPSTLSEALMNQSYSKSLSLSSSVAPVTYSLASGALPAGLSMSSTGVISGTPTVTGTFSLELYAQDTRGFYATRSYSLQVLTHARPTASAGADQTLLPGLEARLDGAGSNSAGGHSPLTYRWTQTGGTAVTLSDATAAAPTFTTPGTPGTLTFTLAVTDSTGLVSANSDSVSIAVVALKAAAASPSARGKPIGFTATATTDPDVTYSWDFGDGSAPGSGHTVQHSYGSAGSYTATVSVATTLGTLSASTTVLVLDRDTSPGGVTTGLNFWLDAGTGIASPTPGGTIATWEDQSGRELHVTQASTSSQPTYQADQWNGHPLVRFDATDYLTRTVEGSALFASDQATIFFAKQSTSGVVWFKWETGTTNRVGFELSSGATRFDMPNEFSSGGRLVGTTMINNGPHLITGRKESTAQQIYVDGAQDATRSNSNTLGTSARADLIIGKHIGGSLSWAGDLAEVIVYGRALSAAERGQVESYLALKYGLTLGSSTKPISYTSSLGDVIWGAGSGSYQRNVAGIGRDDASGLDQRESSSTSSGDIISVAHGTLTETVALPADRAFLVWGHNGGGSSSTSTGTTSAGRNYTRLARTWRAQRTGTLGDVTIAFNLSGLQARPSTPTLLVDDDGNFSNAALHTDGRTVVDNTVSFTLASLPETAYLALALEVDPQLTVTKSGSGSGQVSSSPDGINCGATCSAAFTLGTVVTLTATVDAGSYFAGWSGACGGDGACVVTMSSDKTIAASFQPCQPSVTVSSAADSGAGSLRKALEMVCAGGTISFAGDYRIALQDNLALGKALTIDGGGHSVVLDGAAAADATRNGGIFEIAASTAVTLTGLTLTGGEALAGGAIYNAGSLTLDSSAVISNTAQGFGFGGGGIANAGNLTVVNSTLAGNRVVGAMGDGGGISSNASGALTLRHVTLSANEAAGVDNLYTQGFLTIQNSIIAGGASLDCLAAMVQSWGTLVEDGGCSAQLSGDPLLAPLGDYGGATPTYALLPGSPALHAGEGVYCEEEDQRGVARPQGYGCDLGAYEQRVVSLASIKRLSPASDTVPAGSVTFQVVLPEPMSGLDAADFSVAALDGSLSGGAIISVSGAGTTWSVTVNTGSGSGSMTMIVSATAQALDGAGRPVTLLDGTGHEAYRVYSEFIYVDASAGGANDGSSWANAYTRLSTALGAAASGDLVLLADGTYKPTTGTSRGATMTVKAGVTVYGGFVGGEAEVGQRAWQSNVAVLSGDIGAQGSAADNSYRVVTLEEGAVLDGVTISGGNADGGGELSNGGGLYLGSAMWRLSNIVLSGNRASVHGGGLYVAGGDLVLSNFTISGNSAGLNGGLYKAAGALTLLDSVVSGNTAGEHGGGVFNLNGALLLTNVVLSGNRAVAHGGGLYNQNGTPTLTNVTVGGNSAGGSGGGLYSDFNTTAVRNSIIWGNRAGNVGNSFFDAMGQHQFTASIVEGGGGSLDVDPRFIAPVAATSAPTTTGNLRLQADSPALDAGDNTVVQPELPATDLDGNPRRSDSAAVADSGVGAAPIVDLGAYEARAIAISAITRQSPTSSATGAPSVTFTVVLAESVSGLDASDFVVKVTGGAVSGAAITAVSGAGATWSVTISTGDGAGTIRVAPSAAAQVLDADGRAAGLLDLASGESYTVYDRIVYVDAGASGANDGSSWASAYVRLTSAMNGASGGDMIWVADGTYKPTTGTSRSATFLLQEGVAVYGGFAGGESVLEQRSWAANVAVLSGDIGAAGNGDNSYHVVTGADGAILDGFTITAGNASGDGEQAQGGGIYTGATSPALANLIISGNSAALAGGGMYSGGSLVMSDVVFRDNTAPDAAGLASEGALTLTGALFEGNSASLNGGGLSIAGTGPAVLSEVTVRDNSAGDCGGGLAVYGVSLTVRDSSFSGNSAGENGGGLCNTTNATVELASVSFSGNSAGQRGGGIYNQSGTPELTNVVVSGNSANNQGGGIYNLSADPTLVNVTLSGNWSATRGGGMYTEAGFPTIRNSILWHNYRAGGTPSQLDGGTSWAAISFSIVEGSGGSAAWTQPGSVDEGNNLDADPLFVTPLVGTVAPTTTGDLRLRPESPAIDAGDDALIGASTDLDGNPRSVGAGSDLGAYERQVRITSALPQASAREGAAYSHTFTAIGLSTPISLTFAVDAGALPPGLTLSTSGVLSGTPSASGTYTATVTASNAYGEDSQTFSIAISALPVASAQTVTLAEDGAALITLGGSDADGAELSFIITSLPLSGTLTVSGTLSPLGSGDLPYSMPAGVRELTYRPAANGHGSPYASFSFGVDDGTDVDTATVTLNVTPVADTPSVTGASTLEDTQSSGGLVISRSAVDGAEVSHFQITDISGGTLYHSDGTTAIGAGDFITVAQGAAGLRFTPTANSTASGSFAVQASTSGEASGLSGGLVTATIAITPVDDDPTLDAIADPAPIMSSAGLQTIQLSGISAGAGESQPLTVTVTSSNPALIPQPAVSYTSPEPSGSLSYAPVVGKYGTATITVTVADEGGRSVSRSFVVTVSPRYRGYLPLVGLT